MSTVGSAWGDGGSNILSSGSAAKMSLPCANGLMGKALPWVSSPSFTTKVPGALVVDGALALLSLSRAGNSPSSLTDVGGDGMPLKLRTSGFDTHRSFSGELAADPLRLGGSVRAALPCPKERRDPRLVCTEACDGPDGASVGVPGGDGDVSTHSSTSSSVCHAGAPDAMAYKKPGSVDMRKSWVGYGTSLLSLLWSEVSRAKQP